MIRAQDLTADQVTTLIGECFRDLSQEADVLFRPMSDLPVVEIAEQRELSERRLEELTAQIGERRASPSSSAAAAHYLQTRGVDVQDAPDDRRNVIEIGVMRGWAEQQRIFQHRLAEPVLPYVSQEPLAGRSTSSPPIESAPACGLKVCDLVEDYLRSKKTSWTAKTLTTNSQKLAYLVQHLGADKITSTVKATDVASFAEAVSRLRRNHHVGPGKGFFERQTDAEAYRIAPKTAKLVLETAKAFFRWSYERGHIATNPAAHITITVPKGPKTFHGKKARRPFTEAELGRLFRAPPFTGRASVHRPLQPGKVYVRDAFFWVPLLGFYTGMRLGEIVQLHLSDLHLGEPFPFIGVSEDNAGEIGSGSEKHVKSNAGVRRVPVHPDLIALGLGDFVKLRSKSKKAQVRLFWEIGFGKDGQPSSLFSKWFGRFLDKVGLTDRSLVFHSFRHGMQDAFKNALVPQYVTDQVIGHADGKVSSLYGQGVSIEVAHQAVRSLTLVGRPIHLLKAPDLPPCI